MNAGPAENNRIDDFLYLHNYGSFVTFLSSSSSGLAWYIVSTTSSPSNENKKMGYDSIAYIKSTKNSLVIRTIDNMMVDFQTDLLLELLSMPVIPHYYAIRTSVQVG